MFKSFLLCLLFVLGVSEVVIIDNQVTPEKEYSEYTEKLIEMSTTNQFQVKSMTIGGRQVDCYIPVANHLLFSQSNRTELQTAEATSDSILPLRHMCAIYRTREFLYELCSGKHVRQFDDPITIQNMGKKAPENIRMGNSKAIQSVNRLGRRLINSVPKKNRYVVIRDRVGITNYNMPWNRGKYGVDTINVTCQDGRSIVSQIVVVSHTQFVLTAEHKGYCFSPVTHNTIQHGIYRMRVGLSNFINLGNILIGECQTTSSYAFIKTDRRQIIPYKIVERVNNMTLILDRKIEGTEIQCVKKLTKYQIDIFGKTSKGKFNGYVLKFDQDADLQEQDYLLVSYNTPDGQVLFQAKSIEFAFSKRVFLLTQPLAFGSLLKSSMVYFAKITPKQDEDNVVLDLIKNEIEIKVTSPYTNTSTTAKSPVTRIRLKKYQMIKLNSSQVYVTIERNGRGILAKLTGKEWEYSVKGRPVKVRKYPNGSKQIVKENSFYENLTDSAECFHVSGCIWTDSDFAEFCRLKVEEFHTLTALADIQVTVFNLSSPQNSHLRDIRKTRPSAPARHIEYYDQGDRCGEPINADRTTQVEYICGDSWFTVRNVSESKPCQYKLTVETQLLCEQDFQNNVKADGAKQTICIATWW